MLKQRIITALVLLPIVIGLFFLATLEYFLPPVILLIYLMALEWAGLSGFNSATKSSVFALLVCLINIALLMFSDSFTFWPSLTWPYQLNWDLPVIALAAAFLAIIALLFIVLGYPRMTQLWSSVLVKSLLGIILLSGFFVALISIKAIECHQTTLVGGKYLLLMFVIIWAADSGAYFIGKKFGKRKLAPQLSPKKTWEGVIGGIVCSLLVGWLTINFWSINDGHLASFFAVIFLLACLAVFGDLFESALKREANLKDSGKLLPGHGGVLDRMDSSIVVAPVYYVCFSYMGWF